MLPVELVGDGIEVVDRIKFPLGVRGEPTGWVALYGEDKDLVFCPDHAAAGREA